MKPRPFTPNPLENQPPFVRNLTDQTVWHQCKTRPLYADTDRSQVVYHANYLRFFEFGRSSLMRDAAFPYLEIEESGYIYPIVEVGLKYYIPVRYDEPILVHTRPAELARVTITFDYIITNEETGKIVCTGFTKHCATNTNGVPVAIDPKTLDLWNNFPK